MQKILRSEGHKLVMNSGKEDSGQALRKMGKLFDSTVKHHINYSIISLNSCVTVFHNMSYNYIEVTFNRLALDIS